MILGLGIDLVDPNRMAAALGRSTGTRLAARLFTADEQRDCEARTDRNQALAARFAAKEACLKALGTGFAQGLAFRQIEVVRGPAGRPTLRLTGAAARKASDLGIQRILLTLSHERGMAAAVVILEG